MAPPELWGKLGEFEGMLVARQQNPLRTYQVSTHHVSAVDMVVGKAPKQA